MNQNFFKRLLYNYEPNGKQLKHSRGSIRHVKAKV